MDLTLVDEAKVVWAASVIAALGPEMKAKGEVMISPEEYEALPASIRYVISLLFDV